MAIRKQTNFSNRERKALKNQKVNLINIFLFMIFITTEDHLTLYTQNDFKNRETLTCTLANNKLFCEFLTVN